MDDNQDGFNQLWERQVAAADATTDAAHELARAANGTSGNLLPAPVAYDLIGNLKVMVWHLREVTQFLPEGVRTSLSEPSLEVTDRHPSTGALRDPWHQVEVAASCLRDVDKYLNLAALNLEEAQIALNAQGYSWRADGTPPALPVEVCSRRPSLRDLDDIGGGQRPAAPAFG